MRKLMLTLVAVSGLSLSGAMVSAKDAAKKDGEKEVKGVLIDNACAAAQMEKKNPEESAVGHPKTCATKESCAKSGYAVISGKNLMKFDDEGNALAKKYLDVKENAMKVLVMGVVAEDGKTIKVSQIKAQDEKGGSSKTEKSSDKHADHKH